MIAVPLLVRGLTRFAALRPLDFPTLTLGNLTPAVILTGPSGVGVAVGVTVRVVVRVAVGVTVSVEVAVVDGVGVPTLTEV